MKLFFTRNAIRRLTQIEDYHNKTGNPKKGKRIVREIRSKAKMLEDDPKLGLTEERLEHLGQGHRSILVGTLYRIIYLINTPLVLVTDIFDLRQDSDKIKP